MLFSIDYTAEFILHLCFYIYRNCVTKTCWVLNIFAYSVHDSQVYTYIHILHILFEYTQTDFKI